MSSGTPPPSVSVVTVAFGESPMLAGSVRACLGSTGVEVEVVVVDNGCTDAAIAEVRGLSGVQVVDPGTNLGFAGGCNAGALRAEGEFLAFINPDAIVEPEALAALCETLCDPAVGIATAALLLADRPDLLNSAGNDIHFLGLSWAGKFEEPWDQYRSSREVLAASGGAMAIRRSLFAELGGFEELFFAYFEDADLSLRVWQSGRSIRYVPEARVVHEYSYSKGSLKFFLVDRNRMLLVLRNFPRSWLLLLSPWFVVQELGIAALSIQQGWWRERLRALWWLVQNRREIIAGRRRVARARVVDLAELAPRFVEVVDPRNAPLPAVVVKAQWPLVRYWRLVRARL